MGLKKLIFLIIFAIFSIKTCFSAEIIILKNGKSFEGKILGEKNDKYIIEKYNDNLNINEIIEIKKEDITQIKKTSPIKIRKKPKTIPQPIEHFKNKHIFKKKLKLIKLPLPIPIKVSSKQLSFFYDAKTAIDSTAYQIFYFVLPNADKIPFLKKYASLIFILIVYILGFIISLPLFKPKKPSIKGLVKSKFLETPYKPLKKIKKVKNPFPFIKVFIKLQKEIKSPYYECLCKNITYSNIELLSEINFNKNDVIILTIVLKKQIGKVIDYEDQTFIAVIKEIKKLDKTKYEIKAEFQHLLLSGKAFITKISNKKTN